jgi:hypothetical protein
MTTTLYIATTPELLDEQPTSYAFILQGLHISSRKIRWRKITPSMSWKEPMYHPYMLRHSPKMRLAHLFM